jgi:hypothetical protein
MARGHGIPAFLALLAALCALCSPAPVCGAEEGPGDARIAEVRQGLERRISAVNSVTGTAEVEYRYSPYKCAEIEKRARDTAELLGLDPETPAVDPVQKSLWFFSFDRDKTRWRCETVDLTESENDFWVLSPDPGPNRRFSPDAFRCVAICDGIRSYEYRWSDGRGRIEEPPNAQFLSYGVASLAPVDSAVIRGRSAGFGDHLDDPDYEAVFEGEEELDGRRCLKLTVRRNRPFRSGWYITTWFAPELDFAAVREEIAYCPGGWAPGGAAPAAERRRVVEARDFAKVADLLWCAQTVQEEVLERAAADREPWDYTRVIRIRSLELNTPLQGIEITEDFPPLTSMLGLPPA